MVVEVKEWEESEKEQEKGGENASQPVSIITARR